MFSRTHLKKAAIYAAIAIAVFIISGVVLQGFVMPELPKDLQTNLAWVIGTLILSVTMLSGLSQFSGFSIRDLLPPDASSREAREAQIQGNPPPCQNAPSHPVAPAPSISGYLDHPSGREIVDAIGSVAPFQTESFGANYVGLRVRWDAHLFSVTPGSGGKADVACLFEPGKGGIVRCTIQIAQYPQLKIMRRGDKLHLQGTISEVDGRLNVITLSDCALVFD